MTRNLLPTDIELASRLVADGRSSDNVVAALVSRGVDAATAAQVADDLLHGRKVEPEIPATLEIAPRRRRSKGSQPQQPPPPASPSAGEESHRRRRTRPPGPKPQVSILAWLLGIAVCGALVVATVLLIKDASRQRANAAQSAQGTVMATGPSVRAPDSTRSSTQPPTQAGKRTVAASQTTRGTAPTTSTGPNGELSPAQLVLELTPDGLRIGGKLVNPGNILGSVSEILHSARRTAQGGRSEKGVYAFDKEGLLVYSGQVAGKQSVVLDCEGSGGANGTAAPFTGSLRIEDQVIRADIDSATLAGIKQLGVTDPVLSGGILSGRYHDYELTFAYLKSPQRLSLIEIDLK
jgi:hypothetical protein